MPASKYRLFLVTTHTNLPGSSQPVDALGGQRWDETGFNTRQALPSLLAMTDFRYHIAVALIEEGVWQQRALTLLQRFCHAFFFEHLGSSASTSHNNQPCNKPWKEEDIRQITAIEQMGWTTRTLEEVTRDCESIFSISLPSSNPAFEGNWEKSSNRLFNYFLTFFCVGNIILKNCWPNWPNPYYNPLWWNCHDVAIFLIHLIDESTISARKLPRLYRLLCTLRQKIKQELEEKWKSWGEKGALASLEYLKLVVISGTGVVQIMCGFSTILIVTNPILHAAVLLGFAIPIVAGYPSIHEMLSLKKRNRIIAYLEKLKEFRGWIGDNVEDAEIDILDKCFALFEEWVTTHM